jgi:photosystem II stability/assembly factor-like uncharacterized protein/RecA/RadA recombinase
MTAPNEMKRAMALFCGLTFLFVLCIQAGCSRQEIQRISGESTAKPAREMHWQVIHTSLKGIWTQDGVNVWAVGRGGMILHSSDRGETWDLNESGTYETLNSVFGIPSGGQVQLWAVGNGGVIVYSDGGKTWKRQSSGSQHSLNAVWGVNQGGNIQIWAVGSSGLVTSSGDGGKTWRSQHYEAENLTALWGISQGNTVLVWAAGDHDVLHSSDGGKTWIQAAAVGGIHMKKRHDPQLDDKMAAETGLFISSLWGIQKRGKVELWATAGVSVLYSDDGGTTWTARGPGGGSSYKHPYEINALWGSTLGDQVHLWAVRSDGEIVHSDNEGETWDYQSAQTRASLNAISGARNGAELEVWAVGEEGAVLQTGDQGKSWRVKQVGLPRRLTALWGEGQGDKIDLWATSVDQDSIGGTSSYEDTDTGGMILHSADGAKTWSSQHTSATLRSIWGTANRQELQLWAVGKDGVILHSGNGGTTWDQQHSGTQIALSALWGVEKGDKVHLWAVGKKGMILYSGDAGKTWSAQQKESADAFDLVSIWGKDDGRGIKLWVLGYRNQALAEAILHSADAGRTWQRQLIDSNMGVLESIWGIGERDRLQLWVAGVRLILHSKDLGKTWSQQASEGGVNFTSLWGAQEGDIVELWAVGSGGEIAHSPDGGATWNRDQNVSTSSLAALWGCSKAGKLQLWAVGDDAVMLHGTEIDVYPSVLAARFLSTVNSTQLQVTIQNSGVSERELSVSAHGLNEQYLEQNAWKPLGGLQSIRLKRGESKRLLFPVEADKIAIRPGDGLAFQVRFECAGFKQVFAGVLIYERWKWFREHIAGIATAAIIAAILFLFTTLLFLSPLSLRSLQHKMQIYELVSTIPIPVLGDLLRAILKLSLLPWFAQHRRVLDAWVESAIPKARERLIKSQPETKQHESYAPLPLRLPRSAETIERPTAQSVASFFAGRRSAVEIVGGGGSGKTTLALQMARWAMEGGTNGLMPHRLLPVFIDEDVGKKHDILAIIRRKLHAWFSDDKVDKDFLDALLKKKRILVIVDRLSERKAITQECVRFIHSKTNVNALIVTSRTETGFEGENAVQIHPMPLDTSNLLYFMLHLLDRLPEETRKRFADPNDQLELGRRLAGLLVTRTGEQPPITPLLVKLFVDKTVKLATENPSIPLSQLALPVSIPEVYFDYLCGLNPHGAEAADELEDSRMLELARTLASLALGDEFVPKEFTATMARERLKLSRPATERVLGRFVANGVFFKKRVGGVDIYRFILDPIAETLGAFEHALSCGSDPIKWEGLIEAVLRRGESGKGFLLALRQVWSDYRMQFEWPKWPPG